MPGEFRPPEFLSLYLPRSQSSPLVIKSSQPSFIGVLGLSLSSLELCPLVERSFPYDYLEQVSSFLVSASQAGSVQGPPFCVKKAHQGLHQTRVLAHQRKPSTKQKDNLLSWGR